MRHFDSEIKEMKNLFGRYEIPVTNIRSERAYVISMFAEELNKNLNGRKPLTNAFIAFKTSHLSVEDLKWLFYESKKAKNFGAFWWWSLKPQPEQIQ